ncbi:MAG: N-acetylmuramoyl-L-alanine amidase [Rhodospirillales bacterium]|nr:MAG: N-acetylmuramoyl-L-alanine amidase [Rhodospirillales bacterium]
MIHRPSPNCGPRPDGVAIDMLVLHYTGMRSAEAALERMCDGTAKVSAHYCIDEDGSVTRLVSEAERAWHAGVASWRGATNINDRSIGIELVNPGHEFGYRPFPAEQIDALTLLASAILRRHPIPPRNVVGHSDIAPARKRDPGELFDWSRLARVGIGLWPQPLPAAPADVPRMLEAYGYRADEEGVVVAFQRHFRPSRIDGVADDETAALLAGLLAIAD